MGGQEKSSEETTATSKRRDGHWQPAAAGGRSGRVQGPFRKVLLIGSANTAWKKEVSDVLASGRRDSAVTEVTKTTEGQVLVGARGQEFGLVMSEVSVKRVQAEMSRQLDKRPWRAGPGWIYTLGS